MPKINCIWCGSEYVAFNDSRKHCKRPGCRQREIETNLNHIANFFGLILRHGIKTSIEIRLPGNDTLGKQAKVVSYGDVNSKICRQRDIIINIDEQVRRVKDYFRSLLWKNIKGNFIIKTDSNGLMHEKIEHEIFTAIDSPVILGDNKVIHLADPKNFITKGG